MMSLTSRGEPSIAELYAVYKQYHNSDTVIPTMQQRCRSKHATPSVTQLPHCWCWC